MTQKVIFLVGDAKTGKTEYRLDHLSEYSVVHTLPQLSWVLRHGAPVVVFDPDGLAFDVEVLRFEPGVGKVEA